MYARARSDFAWGHFGKSLLWAGVESLAFYLLVSVHGIAPALAGLALFASMTWNAVLDGLFGIAIARQWIARRSLRWMNKVAIGLAGLSFALLPLALPGGATVPIALLFITRSAFSLIDVQHNLASAPLADTVGHLHTARLRAVLATFAAAAVAFAAAPLLDVADHGPLLPLLLVSAVGLVSSLCMIPVPRLLDRTFEHASPDDAALFGVQPVLIGYAAIVALGFAGLGAVPKALLQIDFAYGWQSASVLPILTLARLSANPVSALLVAHGGILPALQKALLASGAVSMLLPLAGNFVLLDVILLASFGIAAGAVALLSWARLTQVLAFGGGRSAPVGFFTMFMKFGLGASGLIAGFWLDDAASSARAVTPQNLVPLCLAVLICCIMAAALLGVSRAPPSEVET